MGTPTLDLESVAEVCRRFGVRRLAIFGSAVTGGFDPESSDVDLLVEFHAALPSRFDAYFDLKEALEDLFGVPVDLVSPKSLQNPYFAASVEASLQELYAA